MELLVLGFMALAGLLSHFLKDVISIQRKEKKFISPIDYVKLYPYQTMLCILGMFVGVVGLNELNQLTNVTAFCAGYMSNSMADIIGKRSGIKGK